MIRLLQDSRLFRFAAGLLLVIGLAWAGFALAIALIPSYGATPDELALELPGDALYPDAPINWKHAISIDASPEEVWRWIIQMGDDRAAFYSYMFIERFVDPTPGRYINATRVHPEWQNPPVGLPIIQNALAIRAYEPGQYLLAAAADEPGAMGWVWLWHIRPEQGGGTRLNVHMHIQPVAEGPQNPLLNHFIGLGAFIMERNMMSGIKIRAEGGGEPAWIEPLEIIIWLAALLLGLAAAGRFVFGPRGRLGWQALLVGLLALSALFVFTFLQPAVWLRLAADLALLAGLVWGWSPRGLPARAALKPAQQAA